ncbi:hypothetical protein AUP42_19730 [Thalassospira lucentensis]|uniref:Uncharacterized protein n=1 Tax=Thalassospira lucentensis TaxID=168935 RepID=A0A154L482_9PROT|nr:hypothetical protein AUP42_19730 [Thalassospira lucentensis]RCK32685.1 hypothetical protein TH9_13330 [Thalassospira xiamenensis]
MTSCLCLGWVPAGTIRTGAPVKMFLLLGLSLFFVFFLLTFEFLVGQLDMFVGIFRWWYGGGGRCALEGGGALCCPAVIPP